ncbi:MAG: class I SAM-dependent methyltransferase, partial [Candidatus Omnitrophota bacterium]
MVVDTDKDYYHHCRAEVLAHVPLSARMVLDVGCGAGLFAAALKQRQQAEVWGAELNVAVAGQAKGNVDRLLTGDITVLVDDLPDDHFDCIVCNDVLEHIYDPSALLQKFASKLTKTGVLICSIPNIRFIRVLKDLLLKKKWEYADSGILDITHVRFFTATSIANMFCRCGYQILELKGLNPR